MELTGEALHAPVGLRGRLLGRLRASSLAAQFLVAGGLVSIVVLLVVGFVVTRAIENAVTRNAAATTALYVDSVIAPLLPDMQRNDFLGDTVTRALDETLGQGALGERLVSFRLWRNDGTVLYASEKALRGKQFTPNPKLRRAFAGEVVAQFDAVDDPESEAERASGLPLLEIYNPVRQPWSGEVVAVTEFYEVATDFRRDLRRAVLRSWLAVAGATLAFFLVLSTIVVRGSRTIDRQSAALKERVGELSDLLAQNKSLHTRVQSAARRSTALTESQLRRIGGDLHDGPAQLVAFAALRLDGRAILDPAAGIAERETEIAGIRSSLDDALTEIRAICRGLVLPHIEAAELSDILRRAVEDHRQRTGTAVELHMQEMGRTVPLPLRICIYRFVQEGLNNAFRHANGIGQTVTQTYRDGKLTVTVADQGPGFDPEAREPDNLGLAGLRDRVESLGGRFSLHTAPDGTAVSMTFLDDLEPTP